MTNPTEKQPKDGQAGWIMGYGMPKPDTVESVLAEMRESPLGRYWADRLAAAHAAEVAELRKDRDRLDWLADKDNPIGNVQLPTVCVMSNLDSMRGAIDEAMRLDPELFAAIDACMGESHEA